MEDHQLITSLTIRILIGVPTKHTGSTLTTKESILMVVGLSRRGLTVCELVRTLSVFPNISPGETGALRGCGVGALRTNGRTKDLHLTFI